MSVKVGTEFIVQVDLDIMCESFDIGEVTCIDAGGVVTYTPKYHPHYMSEFKTTSLLRVQAGVRALDEYHREMAAQQEAEIRAETNIPQHLVW